MKAKFVCVRVDAKVKVHAAKILAKEELTLSDAIRIFLAEVVDQKKMPVKLQTTPRIVSGRTLQKIKQAQQARDHARSARGKRSRRFLISAKEAREARVEWPDADLDDS
jgi:addiction module RelB/DinJ family antitoxin